MPSYTTSLRLVQPSAGEYPGSWGDEVNNSLTALVDKAVAGTTSITMTAANYTLTNANGVADEAKSMFLVLGGTPGASFAVIVPSASKLYFVTNNTGFAQTVRTSGTGISVPNGASMTLRCDGTNVVVAQNYFASMTLGSALPVASGGTGSTSTTYCSLTTNVTGTLPVANGGTGANNLTGVVKGNGTSAFTAGSVNLASEVTGTLPVANGGTGAATFTANNVLLGNGTSAFQSVAPGANGNVLTSNGTTWQSTAPSAGGVSTISFGSTGLTPSTATSGAINVAGTLAIANGGTGITSFGTGVATALGQNVTGSGSIVLATSPTLGAATFTGGAQTTPSAVTFSATAMTVDCALSNVFATTFTANVTTAPTISNPRNGQTINWFITQDGTGGRTMTWPSSFRWPTGATRTLSTAANSVDLLVATYLSSTGFWYASLSKGFSA